MRSIISESAIWEMVETVDGAQYPVLLRTESEFDRQLIEDELAMQAGEDLGISPEVYLIAQGRL